MDETYHEPWCDRQHTPRQRCNRALATETATDEGPSPNGASTQAPAPPRQEPDVAEPALRPPAPEYGEPPPDDQPSLQREAAVATDMPPVSRHAAEAWQRTQERLSAGQPSPFDSPAVTTPVPPRERQRPPLGALVALVMLAFVLWRLLRR